jgi:dCMP deaminase
MIISDGYNGTPSGFENICEDTEGDTKWYVLHAEANAILKVAASTQSCKGATLYITMSPCKDCSKLIHQSGIKRLVYLHGYKDDSGIRFLDKAGVSIIQINDIDS